MFRRSSTQESLLEAQWTLPPEKAKRLRSSWADSFRREVLPRINEEPFRPFFKENNGQPNKSIRLLVAVHLLKERFDLTDEQVIESLEFNTLWHHALGLEAKDAHTCQKTLHNFRTLVIREKLGEALFIDMTAEIAKAAGISFARQRQDSTHVISNMAALTRLGLLVETMSHFLRELKREQQGRFDALPPMYAKRYLDREGYFADAKKEQARRRLPVAAQDLFRLVRRYESDEEVSALPSYALLKRVFEEQCKVVERIEPIQVGEAPCEAPEEAMDSAQEVGPVESALSAKTGDCSSPQAPALSVEVVSGGASDSSMVTKVAATPTLVTAVTESTVTGEVEQTARHLEPSQACEAHKATGSAHEIGAAKTAGPSSTQAPVSAMEVMSGGANDSSGLANATSLLMTAMAAIVTRHEVEAVLRAPKEISSASMQSPYDPDATYGHKGKGYEVQLTETCSKENPFQLITSVAVNGAHESDQRALLPAIERLVENQMVPAALLADTGYGSGDNILEAAKKGVLLLAPVQDPNRGAIPDTKWEKPVEPLGSSEPTASAVPPSAAESSADVSPKLEPADFGFSATLGDLHSCPNGKAPEETTSSQDRIDARFRASDCAECPLAANCPGRKTKEGGRTFVFRPAQIATARRQEEQRTPAFKEDYKMRSGIESTNSQLKGKQGADDLRVRGKQRVELVMTFKAMALNAFRYVRHVAGAARCPDEALLPSPAGT